MKLTLTKLNEIDRNDDDLTEISSFIDFCAKKLMIEGDIHVTLVGKFKRPDVYRWF